MKSNYDIKKQILLFFLLLLSYFSFGQENSILYNEINHHYEIGDFNKSPINLFYNVQNKTIGNEKHQTFNIDREKINSIIEKSEKFISIEIPFSETESKTILLKKRQLLDDDFKLVIQNLDNKKESSNKSNYIAYSGLVKDNLNKSLISIVFYNDELYGSVFIEGNEYILSKVAFKENSYKLIEMKINENQQQFACGVSDDNNVSLRNAITEKTQQTPIPKCVKLHFEITKTLNDQFGGINQTIIQFLSQFNLVQTKFANDEITVRVSYLKIWNTDDPFYQTWIGTPGTPGAYQDLGLNSFSILGGVVNGNIGIILGNFSGGVAGLGTFGIPPCSNQAYSSVSIFPNITSANVIMHEIGHNLGSHHTHWCGWVGGAIDNCAATEGGCAPGPTPINGGTIMSYCGSYNTLDNGFGTQPKDVILNTISNTTCITSCNSDISCEDNIVNIVSVNNASSTSFTVNWTSNYPVRVYFKEISASNFTILNTVPLPNNSYIINYIPTTNCTIQKFEIKLVSVCPNGDSKPTVIVYSPQSHLKPYAGLLDNYTCNLSINPTINNLVATGQNLKWYTNETGGSPILSSFIFPINTHIVLYVSQTINGCESERTKIIANFQNIPTPTGTSPQIFNCSTPKIADLEITGTNVLWWTAPTGGLSPNIDTNLQHNTTYYAESNSIEGNCVSPQRFPVLVQINSSGVIPYVIPFTEEFNSKLCNLGYTNDSGYNASGAEVNNTLRVSTFGPNGRVFTRGINLVAGIPIKISFMVKNYSNANNESLVTKIGTDLLYNNQVLLGSIVPGSDTTYNTVAYNFTPNTSGIYYISFNFTSAAYFRGVYIDDLKITSTKVSIVGQNIGTPWTTDIDLLTNDGVNFYKSNYTIPAGELKFRQDNSWTINWGGSTPTGTFPSSIGVQDGYNIFVPAGTYNIQINKNTGAYFFNSNLSIDENTLNKVYIYPNPTYDIINLSVQNEIIEFVKIYDLFGRLLKTKIAADNELQINIQDLPNAVYLMEINTNKGKQSVKVVKK